MPYDPLMDEFPEAQGEDARASFKAGQDTKPAIDALKPGWILSAWENITRAGLGETVFRLGTSLLSIAVVLVVVWGMRAFYLYLRTSTDLVSPAQAALAAPLPTPTPTDVPPQLPPFPEAAAWTADGLSRMASMHTTIPERPRTDVITYTIQKGDTIFGIAENFGLQPETILWGNTYTLADDPHNLKIGIQIIILPRDGVYHKWSEGEGLNGVAKGYGVTPEDIINWPGNHLSPETIGDFSHPNIKPGTMLFVPGGHRAFVTWSAPRISRDNPGVARLLGPGFCGTVMDGAMGTGGFIWPSNNHYLSGYDYSPATNHYGIDIAGSAGDAVYASDNGVVVYAGWNNHGYGNVIVIDHGQGWQTLYAHLSAVGVSCGQSVYQGNVIGAIGSTGNSSGPHLHFEMMSETYGKVNPWNYLP